MNLSKLLLASCLVLGLGACSSSTAGADEPQESEEQAIDDDQQEELDKEVGPEEAEEIDAETTQGDIYDGVPGDTLKNEKVSVTLDGVSYEDAETVQLDEGYELVVCEVTVINDSDETIDFAPGLFTMENNESETSSPIDYQPASMDLVIDSSQIEAGGSLNAKIGFEEPAGETPLILSFTMEGEQTLTWTINR